jgi:hypothetical protein
MVGMHDDAAPTARIRPVLPDRLDAFKVRLLYILHRIGLGL